MRGVSSYKQQRLIFWAFSLFGVAVPLVAVVGMPPSPAQVLPLLYLAVASELAALLPVTWRSGRQYQWTAPLVAAGLVSPGAVGLIAWVCTFDGRRPGRDMTLSSFLYNRATNAIGYTVPALVLSQLPNAAFWAIPVKAIVFGLSVFLLNYSFIGLGFALLQRKSVVQVLLDNLGRAGPQSILILAFAGGMIYVLLQQPSGVGYLLVPGLLGFLFVVRANVAYANKQREARLQTLELAAQTLDARDPYTESHSQRVAEMAVQLAETLGLSTNRVEELRTAGHLHDLGKIGIPDRILNKPEPLTHDEWDLMRRHADIGADMLERHSEFAGIAPMVRAHHERWDGKGYPRGLRASEIPLGARILAVADSFDTITEARLYRKSKLTPLEAVDDISLRSASWYDPVVVNALRQVYNLQPLPGAEEERTDARGLELLTKHPRFAWLLTGMTVSALGDPLTTVGSLVAIYAVSRSPLAVAGAYLVKALATVLMTSAFSSLVDRLPRTRVIFIADMIRGGLMILTPALLFLWIWSVLPILFLLALAGGMSQPARLAAVREVVGGGELGRANALLQMGDMVAKLVGYPLAGLLLWMTANTWNWLFAIDGLTFVFAALTILRVGPIGGGISDVPVYSGLSRAWGVVAARSHLVVAGLAAFLLGMSLPTLIVFAYHVSPGGPQAYTILEAALASGVVTGTIVVSRFANIGAMRTVMIGLGLMGALSIGFAISPVLPLAAVLLFGASIGNPIYFVGNQTALMEAGGDRTGTLMAVRFGLTQATAMLGSAVAGVLNSTGGPRWTYLALGVGLAVLAAGAGFAGRARRLTTVSAPAFVPGDLEEQARAMAVEVKAV